MTTSSPPLASVIIPCYNAAGFIDETLDSILAQDYRPLEILVIDDGSTDDTAAVMARRRNAPEIRFIRSSIASGGPSTPRNIGLAHASGECIFLFDSDDVMLPGKIRRTMEAYGQARAQGLKPGLFCSNFQTIDPAGNVLLEDYLAPYRVFQAAPRRPLGGPAYLLPQPEAYAALLHENYIGTSSTMTPRWVFETGLRFDETLKNADDADLWFRICRSYDVVYLDMIGHSYRRHVRNLTQDQSPRIPRNRVIPLERQLANPELTPAARRLLRRRISNHYLSIAYRHQERNEYLASLGGYLSGFLRHRQARFLRGMLVSTAKQAKRLWSGPRSAA